MPFCNLRVMATLLHPPAPHDDPHPKKHGRFGLLRKSRKKSAEKLSAQAPVLPQLPIFESETEKRKSAEEGGQRLEADPAGEWLSEKPQAQEKEREGREQRNARPKTPDVDMELRKHLRDEGMAFLAYADFAAPAQEKPLPFQKAVTKPVQRPPRTPSPPREVKGPVQVEVAPVEVEKKPEVITSMVEIPYAESSRSASVVDIPAKTMKEEPKKEKAVLKKEEPAKKEKSVLKKEESPKEKHKGFFGRLSRKKSREVVAEPTPTIPTEPVPAVPVDVAAQSTTTPAPAPVELVSEQTLVTETPEKKLEESLHSNARSTSPAPVSAPASTLEADISCSSDSKDASTLGTQRDSGLELDSDVSVAEVSQEHPKPRRPRSDSREMARRRLEGAAPGTHDPRAMHRDARGPPPHPHQGRPMHPDRRHSQMRPGPHPNMRRHSGHPPPHGRPPHAPPLHHPHGPHHRRPPPGSGYPVSGNVSEETIPELEETPTRPRRSQSENRAPKRPTPPAHPTNPKIHISRPSNTSVSSLDSHASSTSAERASFTLPPPLMLPPSTAYTPDLTPTQLNCDTHHAHTIVSSNLHHRIMCMVCANNTSAERHLCTYCALRFCLRCRDHFRAGRTIPDIRALPADDPPAADTPPAPLDTPPNVPWAIASALEEPSPPPPRRPHPARRPRPSPPRTSRNPPAPPRRPRPRPEEYADISAAIPRFDAGPYAHSARATGEGEFALPAETRESPRAPLKKVPRHLVGFV